MRRLTRLLPIITFILFPKIKTWAVCPVCTVAVAGGLGISRWVGIDDSVMGVWIGGLIVSSGLWLADWIGKKNWKIPQIKLLSTLLFYIFVVPPLYWAGMIGLPNNNLWGIDKLILGIILGSTSFLLSVGIDTWLRSKNKGKVYIYYQKVIIPIFMLTIASFILYLITI